MFWLTFREGWSTIDRQLEMNSFVILQLPASWEIGEQKTIRVCLSFSFVFLFDWCYIFLLLKVFPSMRGLLWRTTLFAAFSIDRMKQYCSNTFFTTINRAITLRNLKLLRRIELLIYVELYVIEGREWRAAIL